MTATAHATTTANPTPARGRPMDVLRYYAANLVMGIAILGFALGGQWGWLGLGTFGVLLVFDVALPPDHNPRRVNVPRWVMDIPLWIHVVLMGVLWTLFLVRLSQWQAGDGVSGWDVLAMSATCAWIGFIPNVPVAHELFHRRHGFPIAVGKVLNTFFLDPNRDVAHRTTHHLDLCTPEDPDTPYRGQSMYSFVWQASVGAFKDGIVGNWRSLRKRELPLFHYRNALYVELGFLGILGAVAWLAASWQGMSVVYGTSFASKLILEGVNYLQHYGLVRVPGTSIRIHHAWNHLGVMVRPVAMEITNHIHHHYDTQNRFFELTPEPKAPQMPSALLCYLATFVPPVWEKKIAMPRLREWDEKFASPAEQRLAMEANRRAGWPIWIELPDAAPARSGTLLTSTGR